MAVDPYGRNTKRGVVLNNRTLEMLEVAEMRWLQTYGFIPLQLSQGSYNAGGVSASAGTHDGGGALDVRASVLTQRQIDAVVWALRRIGFAAWHRIPDQGDWPEHIHAIAIGDKELSTGAKVQVVAYKNGRNGLANNGPDDGPDVAWTEYRQDIDLSYYGPEKWDDKDIARLRAIVWNTRIADSVTPNPDDLIDIDEVLKNDRKRLFDTKALLNQVDGKIDQLVAALPKP